MDLTTGSQNILIGYNSTIAGAAYGSTIVFGFGLTSKGDGTGMYGGSSVYNQGNTTAWQQVSDIRIKKNIEDCNTGLDLINAINVKNFEYRTEDEITELPKSNVVDKQGIQVGVIAQELETIAPEMVTTDDKEMKSVNTDNFTWYLINAVQELSAEVNALKAKLKD